MTKHATIALITLLAVAAPSARADVSVTFDDGPLSQYTIARPELLRDHLPATFYIISQKLGSMWGPHVTAEQVHQLSLDGFQIGSHSVDHPDLRTLTTTQTTWELTQSKTDLERITGKPVTDFAYPYGYTNPIISHACLSIYQRCRGFGNADINQESLLETADIHAYGVNANTPIAQVHAWIESGRAPGVLVVLVFHNLAEPAPTPSACQPRKFKHAMRYLARSGIRVVTMQQADAS